MAGPVKIVHDGSGLAFCGSSWVRSGKMEQCTTLFHLTMKFGAKSCELVIALNS